METHPQQAQLAVLIDADNANAKRIDALLAEVSKYGRATTKRAYGDWTNTHLGSWKQTLARHAIQPMQQFSNTRGKNSTDSALIIDAMDLLYTERFDGFCIVSSDSDFTRLASRIREAGLTVYGFGERKTPQPFVRACDRFIYVEVLGQDSADDEAPAAATGNGNGGSGERGRRGRRGGGAKKAAAATAAAAEGAARPAAAAEPLAEAPAAEPVAPVEAPSSPAPAPAPAPEAVPAPVAASAPAPVAARGPVIDDPALLVPLHAAVADLGDDEGWAGLGAVGSLIGKRIPEFDPRNWGKKKLSDLFLAIPDFEVEERGEPGRSRQLFVREKRDGSEPVARPAAAPSASPARPEKPRQNRGIHPLPRPSQTRSLARDARDDRPPRPAPSDVAPAPLPAVPAAPLPELKPALEVPMPQDAGWAPRRDERRPTWAVTPEPILATAAAVPAPAVVAATPPAAPEPVAVVPEQAAVPAEADAVAVVEPAAAEAPATARPARKAAAKKAAVKSATAKTAAVKKAAAKAVRKAAPAPVAVEAPAEAPAPARRRSRAKTDPAA